MSIDKSTIVITTKEIINKTKKVALVFHDEEDGIWEFLDGEDVSEDKAAIISISEMGEIDPSIKELLELPRGFGAIRNDENETWKWFKIK